MGFGAKVSQGSIATSGSLLPRAGESLISSVLPRIIWVEVIPVLTSDFPAAPSTESLATTMFTNADSVAAYWGEVSRSAITVEGRVNPWVRLPTDLVGCGPGLCVQQSLDLFTTELTPPTSTPSKTLVLLIYAQSDDVLNGDADNDGRPDIVLGPRRAGIRILRLKNGEWRQSIVDRRPAGLNLPLVIGDLKGNGQNEILAASDFTGEILRYSWKGKGWKRSVFATIPKEHWTWSMNLER